MRSGLRVCSLLLLLLVFQQASAEPLLEQSMDPNYLFNNATFPSRTPVLVGGGSSLRFERSNGPLSCEILMELSLVNAGTLNPGAEIMIEIDATPLTGDNDLAVGITNGVDIVAFQRTDLANAGGSGVLVQAEYLSDHADSILNTVLFTNAGMPDVFSALITLGDGQTMVEGTIGSTSNAGLSSRFIAPSSQISLLVIGNDLQEEYDINLMRVTVVSEPITLSLLALGGLVLTRGRRAA